MSKPRPAKPESSSVSDTITGAIESICKNLVWVGIAGMVVGLGFLIYTFAVAGSGSTNVNASQAMSNIDLFGKVLLGGSLALFLSLTFLYWGEETLGVLQLAGSAALYFAPLFLPQVFGVTAPSEAGSAALGAIQMAGTVTGGMSIVVLLVDIATRIRVRSQQGMRADALKYGKGIKEERDIQNVFLGKCWQLPFCRKFVRERCPIYHSKRTCWKEQVGCMCEEQVIRDAMEGKVIPKDMVAAAKFIPKNNRLTPGQKFERCKQCVIYNEHQKHKYKALLPAVGFGFVAFYMLMRGPLLVMTKGVIDAVDRMIGKATFTQGVGATRTLTEGMIPFHEILLVCFMVIIFAYVLRIMEFLVFKLKV